jgi:hypothetical protein
MKKHFFQNQNKFYRISEYRIAAFETGKQEYEKSKGNFEIIPFDWKTLMHPL